MIPLIRHRSHDGGLITLDSGPTVHEFDGARYAAIDAAVRATGLIAGVSSMALGMGVSVDSNQLQTFLVNQLAFTEATVYAKEFQVRTFRDVVDIKADGGMWANEIRYLKSEIKGTGKRINSTAMDIPTADIEYGDRSVPVYGGAIGYRYDIVELAQSVQIGRSLPADRADAAMEAFEFHMNAVALSGESPLASFFAFSGVPVSTVTGAGWDNLTADEIVNQLNDQIAIYVANTGQNRYPDTLVMSVARQSKLLKPRSSASDKTILQYFLENNLSKLNGVDLKVVAVPQSTGAGAGGLDRIVFYQKRPDVVRMHIPVPLMFLAPQPEGLSVMVPGFYRYAGIEFTRPNAALYVDLPAASAT